MTTATSRKRQKKEADYNQPPWPNRLQLLNEIFISWAIYFSGNFTYTGIIIIYVRDMCILPTRLASHVFTEIFLFLKLLERFLGRCHGTFNKLFIFFLVLDKKSVSLYISFPRTVTLTSIKKVQSSWRGKPQETINETTEIFPGLSINPFYIFSSVLGRWIWGHIFNFLPDSSLT